MKTQAKSRKEGLDFLEEPHDLCACGFLCFLVICASLLIIRFELLGNLPAQPHRFLLGNVPRFDDISNLHHALSVVGGVPEMQTSGHLSKQRRSSNGLIHAHTHLREVVQWSGYPFHEERVEGISRFIPLKVPDLELDEYFQEFVEDCIPAGFSGDGLLHVSQHGDPLFSKILPPFGPDIGRCWGSSSRFACPAYKEGVGYKVESVSTARKGVELKLHRQGNDMPFFECSHPCSYAFRPEDRGQWYLAVASKPHSDSSERDSEVRRIYVSFPIACGAGFFTQPSLKCSLQPLGTVEVLDRLRDLWDGPSTATPELPFGFELEGGMRVPYSEQEYPKRFKPVKAYFDGDRTSSTWMALQQNFWDDQYDDNLRGVRHCFDLVTGGKFSDWRWESEDDTFLPHETSDANEILSVPMEFTPPERPNLWGRRGMETMTEAISGLVATGFQANPRSSFDLHLMLRERGYEWTDSDLAYFFVGYARAQYVLDYLTPSQRVNQYGGAGLYLWDPKVQYLFRNLHHLAKTSSIGQISNSKWLCDAILGEGECDLPRHNSWPSKHTPLRHYAINFAKIHSFHSIELRGYGASNNPEHHARWTDLVLRMASHFRKDGFLKRFLDEDEETDLKQLHAAQETMSLEQLFDELDLPASSRAFYENQGWAKIGGGGSWGRNCVDDMPSHHGRNSSGAKVSSSRSSSEAIAVRSGAKLERGDNRTHVHMRGRDHHRALHVDNA